MRAEFLLSVGSGELRVRGSGRGVDDPSAGAESLLRQGSCRAPAGTGRREGLRQGARPAAPWAVSHAASACSAGACPTGRLLRGRPRPARTPGLGGSGGGLREHGQGNDPTGGLGTSSLAATPCPWAAGREGGRALGGPPGALRRSPEGTPPPPPGLRTFGLVTQRLEKLTPNCQEAGTRREASWVLRRQRRVSDHAEMWRPSRVASGG